MNTKLCPCCKSSFETQWKTKIYCSPKCKRRTKVSRHDAEYTRMRDRVTRHKIKVIVLTHYGNGKLKCIQCGESRLACLSIDHINNNGNQDRKNKKLYGSNFQKMLKYTGFPLGYQTLCMNCQFVKMHDFNEMRIKPVPVT